MKVRKIIKKMYRAILKHNKKREKKLWLKALEKSLKNKNTHVIR